MSNQGAQSHLSSAGAELLTPFHSAGSWFLHVMPEQVQGHVLIQEDLNPTHPLVKRKELEPGLKLQNISVSQMQGHFLLPSSGVRLSKPHSDFSTRCIYSSLADLTKA